MQEQRLKGLITTLCLVLCLLCNAQTVNDLPDQPTETEQDIFENMRPDDKAAVVAVHTGTTDNYAIRVCLTPFNERLSKTFPSYDFREAWTDMDAISQCAERGLTRQSLSDVLEELANDGYTRVLLQSSELMKGIEYDFMQHEVSSIAERFRRIRLAPPLLNTVTDYEKAILAIAAEYGIEKSVNILVCSSLHGEDESCFTMLEYILHDKGYTNWYVVNADGFPSAKSLIRQLKLQKNKRTNLIPCCFATSAKQQTALTALSKELSSAGYKTTIIEHTLGEAKSIINLLTDRAKHTQLFRAYTPVERRLLIRMK